jgi:outer membrane protein
MQYIRICMGLTKPAASLKTIALTLACLFTTPAAYADDLLDVYKTARDNDAILGAATASFSASKELIPQARAGLLPSLGGSVNTSQIDRSISITEQTNRPTEIYNDNSWSAQLRQPVLDLASWYALGSAKSSVKAASMQLEAESQDLIVRVIDAYLNILRTKDRLDTTNAEVTAVQRQLEQVQQRFEVGLVAITDVLESQAVYDSTLVRRIQAESDHDISFETLSTLTGRSYDQLARLSQSLPIVDPYPKDEEIWVETALNSNLAVKAASAQLASARSNARARRADHLPTVDATATYANNVTGGQNFFGAQGDTTTKNTVYGLQLTVPLYQGGVVRSRVREANARVSQSQEQLLNQKRAVIRNTRNLFKSVATDVVRVKARLKAIRSSQSALEATETGYEVGTRNIVDVLQAQQRLFSAQYDYADSRYNYVINLMRLKQATGKLSQDDLEELNQFIDNNDLVGREILLGPG